MMCRQWCVLVVSVLWSGFAFAAIKGKVQSVDGRPIANARVLCRLYEGEGKERRFVTKTDGQGNFVFPEAVITPQSHGASLLALAEGYGIGGCFIRSENPNVRFTDRTLPPDRPATITLFPESLLEFRVVDEKGKAVAGVKVTVATVILPRSPFVREFFEVPLPTWLTIGDIAEELGLTAVSNAEGLVRLHHLPAGGSVHLWLEHERFGRIIKPAGTDDPDFRLTRSPLTILPDLVLEEPGEAEGEVRYEDGKPAAGVRLYFSNIPSRWVRGEVVTDEQGRYRLPRLQPDNYEVSLHYKEPLAKEWAVEPPNITFAVRSGQKVSLPPLTLTKGGILEGVVTDAETGRPIEGVVIGVVRLFPQADYPTLKWVARTKTDKDGRYRVRVSPGDFELYIGEPKGYLPAVPLEMMAIGRNPYRGKVTAGETTRMDIQLRRALTVRGRVVDEQGKPLAGAVVVELTSDPLPQRVVTDEQGNFVLTETAPLKQLHLRAYYEDWRTPSDVTVFADDPKAQRIELRLVKGQKPLLRGQVTDDKGKPIPHAEIIAKWTNPAKGSSTERPMALTDEKGRFEVVGLWAGDPYRLVVRADGYSEAIVDLSPLKPSEVRDIGTVKLTPAGAVLAGQLFGDEGAIQGAVVSVLLPSYRTLATRTDREGRFVLSGLAPGQYRVNIREPSRYGILNLEVVIGTPQSEFKVLILSVSPTTSNPAQVEVRNGELRIQLRPVLPQRETERQATKAEGGTQPPEVGKPAPDLSVQLWLNSKPLTLKALRGKVVVLDFCDWFG